MRTQVEAEFVVPVFEDALVGGGEAFDQGWRFRRGCGNQMIAGAAGGRRNPKELGVHASRLSIRRAASPGNTT